MNSRAPSERHDVNFRQYIRSGVLGLVVLSIIAIVVLFRGLSSGEKYESEIVFDPKLLEKFNQSSNKSFQDSRMLVIKSLPVLEEAIRIGGFDDMAFEDLYRGLELKKTDRGILVEFVSDDAERSRKIVHAVIDAYKAFDANLRSIKPEIVRHNP